MKISRMHAWLSLCLLASATLSQAQPADVSTESSEAYPPLHRMGGMDPEHREVMRSTMAAMTPEQRAEMRANMGRNGHGPGAHHQAHGDQHGGHQGGAGQQHRGSQGSRMMEHGMPHGAGQMRGPRRGADD